QMETFQKLMNVRPGHEWDLFEGLDQPADSISNFLAAVPFAKGGERRLQASRIDVPAELKVPIQPKMATQNGFGALLNELARADTPLASRIVTTSPDVTVSTNL